MSLRRNFTTVLSWTIASQLVALIAIPILGRLFAPEAFGVLALYSSVVSICVSMFTLRLEWHIPNSRSERVAGALALGALLLCTVLTVAVGAIFYVFDLHGRMLPWYEELEYGELFILAIAFGVLIGATDSTVTSLRVLHGDLTRLGKSRFVRQMAVSLLSIALFFYFPDHHGLIGAAVIGGILATIYLSYGASLLGRLELAASDGRRLSRILTRAAGRSAVSTVVSINNTFSFEFVPLALIAFYSPELAGLYFLGNRVLAAPVSLISSSMASSFWAHSAELFKSNRRALFEDYLRLTKRLFLISVPFAVGAGLVAQLMPWILGESWRQIAVVMPAMIPMAVGNLVFSGLGHLIVLRKHHYQLVADLARLVLMVACVWTSASLGLEGSTAIFLMSFSSLVGHVVLMLAHLYAYDRIGLRRFSH